MQLYNMGENSIACSSSFLPTKNNTPLDVRTVVENLDEVELIALPFVGMIFYVKSEMKLYVVDELKAQNAGGMIINDAVVKSYRPLAAEVEFATAEEVNAMLEELGLK